MAGWAGVFAARQTGAIKNWGAAMAVLETVLTTAGGALSVTVGAVVGAVVTRRAQDQHWLRDRQLAGYQELPTRALLIPGSTWSGRSDVTFKDLMPRIGHSSIRAAMYCRHAACDRDHAIAAVLDSFIAEARPKITE